MVRLALDTPYVGGITIQPQFGSGRSGHIDPQDRLTHTGVLKRLGPQTEDAVTWRDLTALPCSHPHCCSIGYLIRDDSQQWHSLVSLIGPESLKEKLGLVANRITDAEIPQQLRVAVQESLLGLLSEQSSLSHPQMGEVWRTICESCDLGMSTVLTLASSALPGRRRKIRRLLGEQVVRITVKPFMDMSTMIEERLVQCCVHVGTRSSQDQCAPFCAVQAWPNGFGGAASAAAGATSRSRSGRSFFMVAARNLPVGEAAAPSRRRHAVGAREVAPECRRSGEADAGGHVLDRLVPVSYTHLTLPTILLV